MQIVMHRSRKRDAGAVTREEVVRLLARIQSEAYIDGDEDRQAKLSRIYAMAGDGADRVAREQAT